MQRNYLKQGDTLKLNDKIYTVKSVIGDGATCVVYSAEYKDSLGLSHTVNIKELYPYNTSIIRDGSDLIWELPEEKETHQDAFITTYEKLLAWQYENEIVGVSDICEANNTRYIIMESSKKCVTFDKDKPESLSDILKTVRLLAYYVGKYHQNGYLHLDIKPSNFLVYPRPSEHIVLFDLDTVTSISDIETGKCRSASYSDGWAAPEQKQGKIYKLCPATDIYAIGAVLFEKIMGRQVNNDDIGYFAEWNFESDLFENVNPKIKRLLTNIFKKTLAASVKRRYQNADALIKDLDKAITVSESEVYLKGDDVCCSGYFVGREKELKLIKESFDSKKKAVFLHGIGGIGKTEIARKYAELFKKDYDVVLFVKYDSNFSLQEKLDEIEIENFDGDISDKRKKLRGLLDDKTLVIVDNFDVEIGIDKTLKSLFETKAHILVSTRTDFSSVYSGEKYKQIEITELAGDELEQVFFTNAKINNVSESDSVILNKIFKLIENHTYATELLAKQMYYSGWSLSTLYERVKSGFASLGSAEKIVTNKDEDLTKDNSLNILRAVFRISDLTEGQKQVLINLQLLAFMDVSKESYIKYALTDSNAINEMNTLIEIGLVQYNGLFCTLHPLVEEIVVYDLQPNFNNGAGVYRIIEMKISNCSFFSYDDEAEEYEFEKNCHFLCSFFGRVDLNNTHNRSLLINWLIEMIQNEETSVGDNNDYWFSKIYGRLQNLVENGNVTTCEKSDIYYILLYSWLLEVYYIYRGDEERIEKLEKRREEKIRYFFNKALESCSDLEDSLKNDKLERVFDSVVNMVIGFACNMVPQDIIDTIFNQMPESFEGVSAYDKAKMGLPLTPEESAEIQIFNDEKPDAFKPNYTDEDIDLEASCKKGFRESENKIEYFKSIINNEAYTPMKRAELLNYCTDSVFDVLCLRRFVDSDISYDWETLEEILDLEEDFLVSDECTRATREESENWIYYIKNNTINQIIVYAATNNIEWFENTMDMLLEDIERQIRFFIEHGEYWPRFLDIQAHANFSLYQVNTALQSIKKSHLMVPVLIRILEGWQEYAKRINQYSEKNFFSLYKTIAECAMFASFEEIIDSRYEKDFSEIEYHYRHKMDSIAGVDYILKIED